ncbi:NAD(P)H-hydrate dehydratase, partial [Pseudomonas sp. PNPG3]|uniref:NAD(P)H-hydrate dehydratase n=1 Tax=Pseudomonas sp. PNPG3 TaxID=2919497 RepID=UPI002493DB3F
VTVVGLDDLGRTDALVVGPGLDPEDPRVRAGIAALARGDDGRAAGIRRGAIDAGALGGLRPGDRFTADVVLTPHRGEAARLADRLGLAVDARA